MLSKCANKQSFSQKDDFFSIPDELGYLVDAIVNEDKIGSFDKRPNDLSLEVTFGNIALLQVTSQVSY
jgi:hypothetical protein